MAVDLNERRCEMYGKLIEGTVEGNQKKSRIQVLTASSLEDMLAALKTYRLPQKIMFRKSIW